MPPRNQDTLSLWGGQHPGLMCAGAVKKRLPSLIFTMVLGSIFVSDPPGTHFEEVPIRPDRLVGSLAQLRPVVSSLRYHTTTIPIYLTAAVWARHDTIHEKDESHDHPAVRQTGDRARDRRDG